MSARLEQINFWAVSALAASSLFAYAALLAYAGAINQSLWRPAVVLPVLAVVSFAMLRRAGRRDPDPRFHRLLMLAFSLKVAATLARYLMAFVFYGGVADSSGYDGGGARLAESYRVGDFAAPLGMDLVGTGFIRVLTGLIYTVTGDSIVVAYAVFSWCGFWGLYFFYRAFRVAIPDGDARRYALLVLFLPSMLFWPSGLGKEAWMTLGLGVAAYGCALLLSGAAGRSLLPIVLGTAATAMVRPHVTAILAIALPLALLLGRSARPSTQLTPVVRLASVATLMVGVYGVAQRAAGFLGVSELNAKGVNDAIDDTTSSTDLGGSSFDSGGVSSPLDFPRAVFTVLFRPSLLDANNVQLGIAAVESTVLIVVIVLSLRRLQSVPRLLRQQPYLIVCLVYSAIFIYAFSHFSNFGILVRERVQVLPFVLVLLALPATRPQRPGTCLAGARLPRAPRALLHRPSPDDRNTKVSS